MNANTVTTRHAGCAMTIREINELVYRCGANASFPDRRDILVWGDRAAVRRALACMGLGFDVAQRGMVQPINDTTGRRWGEITYAASGRASALLCYLLSDR